MRGSRGEPPIHGDKVLKLSTGHGGIEIEFNRIGTDRIELAVIDQDSEGQARCMGVLSDYLDGFRSVIAGATYQVANEQVSMLLTLDRHTQRVSYRLEHPSSHTRILSSLSVAELIELTS